MAEADSTPRKGLIVKLYLPRSEKRGPPSEASDSRGQKRMKHHCNNTDFSEVGKNDTKGSRTVSPGEFKLKDDADSRSEKRRKVATTEVSVSAMATKGKTEYPTRSSVHENAKADSRISRTGSEECKLKEEGVECKKEEIPKVKRMDRSKKMQCWVILKRLMIGRDGWAFKQPLDLKDLDILDNSESASKPIGLEDIESKLNKWLYSGPDQFADDVRLVISYALMYPPRNEIHRIARRLSESFELSWKSLKDKWSREDRKGKKILKRGVSSEVYRHAAREVREKKTQKGNKDSSGDTEDSQCCDAYKSLPTQKRGTTNTDSGRNFHYKARSRYCA